MPFVKLDCGMLNSTLWIDRPAREVFITALLMAEPHELLNFTPQLAVETLEQTGWMVPPGWYGLVEAAGVGIIRRAEVEDPIGRLALERLGSPDPGSRSQAFDGRRLVRIDGGYVVLNFMAYRDRDYTAARRAERYRQRQRLKSESSRRDVTPSRRDITQAEAEAEVQADQDRTVAADAPTSSSPEHITVTVKKAHPIKEALTAYEQKFSERFQSPPAPVSGKDAKLMQRLLARFELAEILRRLDLFFASEDAFIVETGYTVGVFSTVWNKLGLPPARRKSRQERAIEATTRENMAAWTRGEIRGGTR